MKKIRSGAASEKQLEYILSLMKKKMFWEKQPKNPSMDFLISEVERRFKVKFDDLDADSAHTIINRLKGALNPTYTSKTSMKNFTPYRKNIPAAHNAELAGHIQRHIKCQKKQPGG